VKRYKVIRCESIMELENEVESHFESGWLLSGGLIIDRDILYVHYIQVIYRDF
jgi:hypothetical protein